MLSIIDGGKAHFEVMELHCSRFESNSKLFNKIFKLEFDGRGILWCR